jgi:dTDP-4-amino-4,6-dideoxygalactose transaminase
MTVPYFNLAYINCDQRLALEKTVFEVINSGNLVLGPQVQNFENEFSAYCGMPYGIGVGNALDGLYIMLLAYGIGPGDEVIVPANTYIATWLAVTRTGATVVPVEPNPDTYCLEADLIAVKITTKTKAILTVHLYGLLVAMSKIRALCDEHDLFLFEDCAQAHGATNATGIAGSFGNASVFSFYPTKNLGAIGDGGIILTRSAESAERARMIRNYGSKTKYVNNVIGINSRLDEVQAAILRKKLPFLAESNTKRIRIAERYLIEIEPNLAMKLPLPIFDGSNVWHIFPILHKKRNELRDFFASLGIETLVHYPIPPYKQQAYKGFGYKSEDFPITNEIHEQTLSIPLWPGMSEQETRYVSTALNRFNLEN